MSSGKYEDKFSCSKCGGTNNSIFLLKLIDDKMLIKFKCPEHGVEVLKLPIKDKDSILPLIRRGLFRCFSCGQEGIVHTIKTSGPWTLLKIFCSEHKVTRQIKIWTTIYDEASNTKSVESQQPVQSTSEEQSHPIESEPEPDSIKEYCNNCGTEKDQSRSIKFCPKCGSPTN